jgi:hypothetical protein
LAARSSVRAAAFSIFALAVAWPLLANAGAMNVFRDAQVLYAYERDATWSVLHFGSLPLWDPYYCGGLFALGTPQSRFASPTFLLSLFFGPARGEALTIFTMILLGLEGTFRYARARGGGSIGSFLVAPAFAISGVFIASPFLGWTNFFGFELVPWALLYLRRAARGEAAAAALAALFLAWIVGFGGTYAAPIIAILASYELAEFLLDRRPDWRAQRRAVGLYVFAAALAIAVAAVRLAPLAETLYVAPRVLAGRPEMTPLEALEVLLRPVAVEDGDLVWSKQMYTVGAGTLILAVVGLGRRRLWPFLPLGAAAFCAALGYALGPLGPFPLLKRLPVFSALRYPERYLIVVGLVAAIAAANGVRSLEIAARRRMWARVALALGAVLLLANAGFLLLDFHAVASKRLLKPPAPEIVRPFQQARGNRWLAAYYAPMSRGSLSCWDAYPVPMSSALRGDLASDEYLLDPGAGSVVRRRWTPNAIDIDVALTRPTELLINQNFHPGWHSDTEGVDNYNGLLAVGLPTGVNHVRLRFRPRSAIAGAVSSLVAVLGAFWFIRRSRRLGSLWWPSTIQLVGVAGVPLALFACAYCLISERRPVAAAIRAPSGEEVLTSGPSPEAVRMDVGFGQAIVLDAVKTPDSLAVSPGEPISIELDWRVVGPVSRDVEISVSIETDGRVVGRVDHELVSAAISFADAPRDATLRDMVPFVVPPSIGPAGLDVWVSVTADRSGSPLPITSKGTAKANGRRVLVASLRPPS